MTDDAFDRLKPGLRDFDNTAFPALESGSSYIIDHSKYDERDVSAMPEEGEEAPEEAAGSPTATTDTQAPEPKKKPIRLDLRHKTIKFQKQTNSFWTHIKANYGPPSPNPSKEPKSRPKRPIHRSLPLLERPLADLAAGTWEWLQAEHPLPQEKTPKTGEPDRRNIHRELPLKERSIIDVSKAVWEWVRAEHPVKLPKPKKKKKGKGKSRKLLLLDQLLQVGKKAKTIRQVPHRPTLPRIPEEEPTSASAPVPQTEISEVHARDSAVPASADDERSDAISVVSSVRAGDHPPRYKRNGTRPPSYMTVE